MKTISDQMGRLVEIPDLPERIISLVPSQTELLFDLGLNGEVVGVTKFCIHPADLVKNKPSIGGTKKFRFDVIDSLQPDLIIGNKEENYQEGIEQLAVKYPVWMSDIHDLPQALAMIQQVGELVDRAEQARSMVRKIENGFAQLPKLPRPYLISTNFSLSLIDQFVDISQALLYSMPNMEPVPFGSISKRQPH